MRPNRFVTARQWQAVGLQTAVQWLLIGVLLGYLLRLAQRPNAKASAARKANLQRLAREFVQAKYEHAIASEDDHHGSSQG